MGVRSFKGKKKGKGKSSSKPMIRTTKRIRTQVTVKNRIVNEDALLTQGEMKKGKERMGKHDTKYFDADIDNDDIPDIRITQSELKKGTTRNEKQMLDSNGRPMEYSDFKQKWKKLPKVKDIMGQEYEYQGDLSVKEYKKMLPKINGFENDDTYKAEWNGSVTNSRYNLYKKQEKSQLKTSSSNTDSDLRDTKKSKADIDMVRSHIIELQDRNSAYKSEYVVENIDDISKYIDDINTDNFRNKGSYSSKEEAIETQNKLLTKFKEITDKNFTANQVKEFASDMKKLASGRGKNYHPDGVGAFDNTVTRLDNNKSEVDAALRYDPQEYVIDWENISYGSRKDQYITYNHIRRALWRSFYNKEKMEGMEDFNKI